MTSSTEDRPPRGGSLLTRLLALLARIEQRRRLAELTDHELRDLGLTRDAVAREVRRPFWR